jgi:hypothetical protein
MVASQEQRSGNRQVYLMAPSLVSFARAELVWRSLLGTAPSPGTVRQSKSPCFNVQSPSLTFPPVLTALFACCGMDIVTFTIGVFVAFPRQFVTVYFGYALASTDVNGRTYLFSHSNKKRYSLLINIVDEPKSKTIVKWTSIVVITVVTIVAMKYIERKEDAVRPDIVYQRRKRRQTKLQALADIEAQKHDGEDVVGGSGRVSSGSPLVIPTPHRAGVPVYPPHT